jgi:hypothetical protein
VADQLALLTEAHNRGILPPDKEALYQEAVRRGLIGAAQDGSRNASGTWMPTDKGPHVGSYAATDTGKPVIVDPAQNPGAFAAQQGTAAQNLGAGYGAETQNIGRSLMDLIQKGAAAMSPGGAGAMLAPSAPNPDQAQQDQLFANSTAANVGKFGADVANTAPFAMAGGEVVAPLADAVKGAGFLPALGRAAISGAGQGAGTAAAMPADDMIDRLENMGTGAVAGGALNSAFSGVGAAASKVLPPVAEFGAKLFSPKATAARTVGNILADASTGTDAGAAPLAGTTLTAGGQTLDPGLQSLEQAVRSRGVNGLSNESMFQVQQRANNKAALDSLGAIANPKAVASEASTSAHNALSAARDALGEQEGTLWGKVPLDTPVNASQTASDLDKYVAKQSFTNQRIIKRLAQEPLDDFKAALSHYAPDEATSTEPTQMPFGEIKDLRSSLGSAIRKAAAAGDDNGARLLRGLDGQLLTSLGRENAFTKGAQNLGAAYNSAREFTAALHNTHFPPEVQNLLDKDPAKFLDAVTSTPQQLTGFLNAAKNAPDKGEGAIQAVRDYLLSKGVGQNSMSARGGTEPFLNGQGLQKWLMQNRGVLSKVFKPDELKQMEAGATSAYRNIASEAASPRIGSNTIQKYLGNRGISGQMAQGDLGSGVVGKAAGGVRNLLLGRYQVATEKLLRDSLLNPKDPDVVAALGSQPWGASILRRAQATKSASARRALAIFAANRLAQLGGIGVSQPSLQTPASPAP